MKNDPTRTVELKNAFWWYCDDCSSKNFDHAVDAEFNDDDEREEVFRAFNDLEEWEDLPDNWRDFELMSSPRFVTCQSCSARFSTEDSRGIKLDEI